MSRKAISAEVTRVLPAKSGGYCQNSTCNKDLFHFFKNGKITNLRELAHIIGQSTDGPRGESSLPLSDRDSYENIILLCPTCHTLVDKNPDQYSVDMLLKWKSEHEARIASCFKVPIYEKRAELISEISKLLRQNRTVYETYGPESSYASALISDAIKMWKRNILEVIIPNNRRLAELLTKNEHFFSDTEREIIAKFLIHKEGFESNHLSGDKNATVTLFPVEIYELLEE